MLSLAPATPGIVADIGLPTMKQGQLHGNGSQYYWFRVLDICVLVVVFGKNLLPDNLSRSVSCKGGAA